MLIFGGVILQLHEVSLLLGARLMPPRKSQHKNETLCFLQVFFGGTQTLQNFQKIQNTRTTTSRKLKLVSFATSQLSCLSNIQLSRNLKDVCFSPLSALRDDRRFGTTPKGCLAERVAAWKSSLKRRSSGLFLLRNVRVDNGWRLFKHFLKV